MNALKTEILSQIPDYIPETYQWHGIEEFSSLIYEKDGYPVYGDAIQAALDRYQCVAIEKQGSMYLEKPLILKSGCRLKLDRYQHIANIPGTLSCMIRNERITNGADAPVAHKNFDTDLSVDGGIWDGGLQEGDGEDKRLVTGLTPECKGALSIMIFVNAENLVVKNAEFKNGGINYAVQLGNVRRFRISDLTFIRYGRDGVHINGPASYGEVCDLYGEDMGDDVVALNAWDWDTSAVTFGTIEKMYVHDNRTTNNELRLLPGRKLYEDCFVDCDIRQCILCRLSGIYTFKLYCQPNIFNAEREDYHDVSGTVGNIYDVWFSDIDVDKNRNSGFHGLPVNGIFDVCADCHDLYFENIRVLATYEEVEKRGMKFMSVGPLSAVWKNGSEDPADWGEVFDPNAVCHVEKVYFQNITFEDCRATTREMLAKEITMTLNPNYPNTIPRGGTGFGKLGEISIE